MRLHQHQVDSVFLPPKTVSLNVAWIVSKFLGLSTQDATDAMDTTCAGYDIYVGNKNVSVGAIALPS